MPTPLVKSKAGWREIAGRRIYFRSMAECNYARYLQFLKEHAQIKEWEHEPKTFWFEEIKRGVRSYLPDFQVKNLDNSTHWVEVKGYWDAKSLTKIKRFNKYYPSEKIILVDSDWFKTNNAKCVGLIPGWEGSRPKIFRRKL